MTATRRVGGRGAWWRGPAAEGGGLVGEKGSGGEPEGPGRRPSGRVGAATTAASAIATGSGTAALPAAAATATDVTAARRTLVKKALQVLVQHLGQVVHDCQLPAAAQLPQQPVDRGGRQRRPRPRLAARRLHRRVRADGAHQLLHLLRGEAGGVLGGQHDYAGGEAMGSQSGFKNELLFREFGINYAHLPEQFKKGSVVLRTRALVEVKRREDGQPVLRERSVPTVLHVDLIRDEFWAEHPELLAP
ncbi:putative tRNA(His) guanylyltransferase [Tetrabaena socialis]|uniref:Putative tRNA(His) guanylyltransferase n=1 Tax=Tetrabaena socialis TaxID=47790 RepID=A0A2J7ZVD8_9CHLO|nr:putative tRNA(His) guanylyltransferase [Tetrabaena socialis]|eukprot:PNH04219.1 putative tRNA(His) guanylyltransferase [Tetrabaena socialis]